MPLDLRVHCAYIGWIAIAFNDLESDSGGMKEILDGKSEEADDWISIDNACIYYEVK